MHFYSADSPLERSLWPKLVHAARCQKKIFEVSGISRYSTISFTQVSKTLELGYDLLAITRYTIFTHLFYVPLVRCLESGLSFDLQAIIRYKTFTQFFYLCSALNYILCPGIHFPLSGLPLERSLWPKPLQDQGVWTDWTGLNFRKRLKSGSSHLNLTYLAAACWWGAD